MTYMISWVGVRNDMDSVFVEDTVTGRIFSTTSGGGYYYEWLNECEEKRKVERREREFWEKREAERERINDYLFPNPAYKEKEHERLINAGIEACERKLYKEREAERKRMDEY